jgi:hypothetical protein
MSNKTRRSPRHCFRFVIQIDEGEKPREIKLWAKVRKATQAVRLTLKAADVRRSIKLGGAGNTQTCTMAVCAKRQKDAFPHPVEGYIDWQYATAYVVSKCDPATGFPSECVVYAHKDEIARLNDSPGGQVKLLERLAWTGDRTITLYPPSEKKPNPFRKPRGENTGERTSRPIAATGARLRFAVAKAGTIG